ncbi:hypothetical protein EJ06DRAFT_527545 [Trichodelitschia bisporula]|uniref:DUF7707 domain-containing protein n=1 Tax=Trichodelitschia bisporula TaxID=703511 RepID=A0A6G1I7J8_9PEZI|nr:hypothetical protein EJ06DRAFT_527545 [Trichodelitschia bisporula]
MRSTAALSLFLAVAGFANSQTIDPSTVSSSLRESWCRDQRSSCPLLCLQESNIATTISNTCDPKTLAWTCVCGSGKTPNMTEYSQTIPYYECTEWGTQCVKNCGQNNACSSDCRQNHPCGAQHPTRVNTSSISPTATKAGSGSDSSASATDAGTFGGANSGTKSGSKSAAAAVSIGQTYGLAVVAAGIFAGFGLLL